MRRLGLAPLVAVIACGGGGNRPAAERTQAGDLAITNVTVVPMDRDGGIAGQTVIIRGDRIVAIAPQDRIEIGAGATRIDGSGKWLMPGLADMHVHTWSENDLTMFVVAGITTVRNMFGSDQHLTWRKQIAEGSRFGPTIVTTSPILDGEPPTWPGSIVLTKPAEVDAVVAGIKAQGYDALKPYSGLDKPVYDALVIAGKKHGLSLQGHVPRAVGLAHAIASNQKSIEHLDGWLNALAPKFERQPKESFPAMLRRLLPLVEEARIPALADAMTKAGTWNCATLVVMDRFGALDNVAAVEKHAKWLHLVAPEIRAIWDPKKDFRLAGTTTEDFAVMREANAVRAKIVRVLAASGAPLLVGTDTGNPYVIPGEAMHDEIELLVAAGAPRPRVMRAATADAGTFLGLAGKVGVVAVGARADLLLVAVDPMAAPLPLVPEGVVLRGSWLPKADLEAKLAALAKPRPATDPFKDLPPLAPEGTDVIEARYEIRSSDNVVGEERIAVGIAGGKRVVVAQEVLEQYGHVEITYRIADRATRMEIKTGFGTLALAAKPDGKQLVATGKDVAGKDVALAAPLPADAFLGAPGIGGTIGLADKIASMKVGDRRTATSLELSYFPKPSIEATSYEVERKPDAAGNRVFAIVLRAGGSVVQSDLVLDAKNTPVTQRYGPPYDLTFVRREP